MTEYINTYNELCEKVKRWSAAYYEQDAPAVTDEEYDRAMHEIRDLEAAHPETRHLRQPNAGSRRQARYWHSG